MCVFTLLIAKMFVGVSDLEEMQWGSFIDAICISDRAKTPIQVNRLLIAKDNGT
jgi:hypothetical protein